MQSTSFTLKLFVIAGLSFLPGLCAAQSTTRIPVILSTDVGNEIDDQWAVTYLLLQPRVRVLGVMSAHAPSITAPAGKTSHRILIDVVENRLAMRNHPPLIEGGSEPLLDSRTAKTSPAVDFLIKESRPFSKDNRLTVLVIGAATDVASAILKDPTIVDRIRVVQMGFSDEAGGEEFNIANDVYAVQAILDSNVPLVIGPGKVCRENLALTLQQAKDMLGPHGPIGAWLLEEFEAWYFRNVKPIRVNDFTRSWPIWDNITLAYVLGMTSQHSLPRPRLRENMTFEHVSTDRSVTWITDVDERQMWSDFFTLIDNYQRTHTIKKRPYGRLTFGMP
jgi:inosine-uridine nucleoside N-ribohydrolase